MNKKQLYESIMQNVAKEVKSALNEGLHNVSLTPFQRNMCEQALKVYALWIMEHSEEAKNNGYTVESFCDMIKSVYDVVRMSSDDSAFPQYKKEDIDLSDKVIKWYREYKKQCDRREMSDFEIGFALGSWVDKCCEDLGLSDPEERRIVRKTLREESLKSYRIHKRIAGN